MIPPSFPQIKVNHDVLQRGLRRHHPRARRRVHLRERLCVGLSAQAPRRHFCFNRCIVRESRATLTTRVSDMFMNVGIAAYIIGNGEWIA